MGRNLLNTKKDFAILANGTYKGAPTTNEERNKAIQGLEIADKLIRSNYFRNYK